MEYNTTTLRDISVGKIEKHEMINEILPLLRRQKINKIIKNKTWFIL